MKHLHGVGERHSYCGVLPILYAHEKDVGTDALKAREGIRIMLTGATIRPAQAAALALRQSVKEARWVRHYVKHMGWGDRDT